MVPTRPSAAAPHGRWPVAVLGATGAVGQTFIRLLQNHPWFEVAELAASERSAGKSYRDATRWLEGPFPASLAKHEVLPCDPAVLRAPIVFSALDAKAAGDIEPAFARAGRVVLSNAKNFRMESDVPLVIPEVNAKHFAALETQRAQRGWQPGGAIITNANCAATGATIALAPLHEAFGIETVMITTMQAISGAGYPGVPSLDILGNVIPYIGEEEEKIEREIPKMLGSWNGSVFTPANLIVSAQANRVAVEHGHMTCLTVKCRSRVTPAQALEALCAWRGDTAAHGLPSAPERALVVMHDDMRPQPRRDVMLGQGMTVSVGRVRADKLFDIRMVALAHNTVRGAAGGSVLNAEVLAARGMLPSAIVTA